MCLVIVAYCGHMWELFCVWAWISQFMEATWSLSSQRSSFFSFFVIAMGGPGSWIGGMLGDRYGKMRVAAASLTLSGACVATLGLLSDDGPLFLRLTLGLLWGLAGLADSPQFSSMVTLYADQKYVGTAITMQLLCGYSITVLALWVEPSVAAVISWRWSFFSLSAGPLAGLCAILALGLMDLIRSRTQGLTQRHA